MTQLNYKLRPAPAVAGSFNSGDRRWPEFVALLTDKAIEIASHSASPATWAGFAELNFSDLITG